MADPKDLWDKTDIVAKVLVPVVVALVGFTYTNQQHARDESQKSIDRIVMLGKSLSSDNFREQQFAITMLRAEKRKHPDDVPDEVLSIALPDLVRLAATAQNAELSSEAKQLALELSANTSVSDSVKKSVDKTPARIYIHIRDEAQRPQAADDARRLQNSLGEDFVVPGIQRVSSGPARNELRYFREADKAEAEKIGRALADGGFGVVALAYLARYENSTAIRPRHFELWYGPPAGNPDAQGREHRRSESWRQDSSVDDIVKTYQVSVPPDVRLVPDSVRAVIEFSRGREGEDWSIAQTVRGSNVLFVVKTVHHSPGVSGAVTFHSEYDIEKPPSTAGDRAAGRVGDPRPR